jgi:hypothetical protein
MTGDDGGTYYGLTRNRIAAGERIVLFVTFKPGSEASAPATVAPPRPPEQLPTDTDPSTTLLLIAVVVSLILIGAALLVRGRTREGK